MQLVRARSARRGASGAGSRCRSCDRDGRRRLRLPRGDGALEAYTPGEPRAFAASGASRPLARGVRRRARRRRPAGGDDPGPRCDWEATLAFRRHLWAHGLASPRRWTRRSAGWGSTGPPTRELIRRVGGRGAAVGGLARCGAGTDQLTRPRPRSPTCAPPTRSSASSSRATGAQAIVMASRALAAIARGPDDYRAVYGVVLDGLERPAILHWLGDDVRPGARADTGAPTISTRPPTCSWRSSHAHADKVDGDQGLAARRRPRDRAAARGCRTACGSTPATTSTTRS